LNFFLLGTDVFFKSVFLGTDVFSFRYRRFFFKVQTCVFLFKVIFKNVKFSLFKSTKIFSKVLRFAFEQIVEILNNRFLLLFESFSFRYRSFLYKCFCIFCKVFSFRYRSFSSVLGKFLKFKVFFVQKQSFLCSKLRFVQKCKDLFKRAKICF